MLDTLFTPLDQHFGQIDLMAKALESHLILLKSSNEGLITVIFPLIELGLGIMVFSGPNPLLGLSAGIPWGRWDGPHLGILEQTAGSNNVEVCR